MKKSLVFLLIFALMFTGCGKADPTPVDPTPPAADDPVQPPPVDPLPEEPVQPQGPLSNLPEGTTVALAELAEPQPQPAPPTCWQVGDKLVELWEGSLLVEDKVLLQGAYDELDPLNIRFYEVEAVLDDHRFFYSCTGYDHMWGYGIYDLRTGTDTPLVVDSPYADSLIVEKIVGDRALMLYTTGPEFGFFLLELNEAFPMTPLPVGYATEAEGLFGTSLANDDLTVMAFLENASEEYRFRVVELATGRALLDWTTPRGDIIDTPRIFLEDGLAVTVQKGDDLWIYRVPYAAPQGPLADLPEGTVVTVGQEPDPAPDPQPVTAWQVGETLVEYREGSLWAGDRELLAGRDWDESQSVYRLAAVLDDHRFLFCHTQHGWSCDATMGVYDLRDDTVTMHDDLSGLQFGAEHQGKLLVYRQSITGLANWDYQLLDLQTLRTERLSGGRHSQATVHNRYVVDSVNETLTRIAMVETTSDGAVVSVEDLPSGKLLFRMELPGNNFWVDLQGQNTLLLYSWQHAECLWRYAIPYADDGSAVIDPPPGAQIGLERAVSRLSLTPGNLTLHLPLPMTETVFLALGWDGVQYNLVSCDAVTGEVLDQAQVEVRDGQWELIHSGSGARFYNGLEYWQITLNDDHQLTLDKIGDGGRLLRMGDHVLDKGRDGSLLVDGRPVLSGDYLELSLLAVVDDHRLLYRQYNSGTGNSSDGLYDHQTGESRLLTYIGQEVWGLWGDTVLIARQEQGQQYKLSVFDLQTMESGETGIVCTAEDQLTANREGTRLAVRRDREVTIYDLLTGESLFVWTIPDRQDWQVCPAGEYGLMVWAENTLWTAEY